MRHEQLERDNDFDIVEIASNEGPEAEALAFLRHRVGRPEAAVPDVPAAIGLLIALVYLLIVGLLAITIASAGQAPFVIAIDLVFLAAFFSIPFLFLKVEGDPAKRPPMSRFLAQGIQTYTGHVTGGGALAQIFVVPLLLAFGVLCIGIVAMLG